MIRATLIWTIWLLIALACAYYAVEALPYIAAPVADLRLKPESSSEEIGLRLHAGGGLIALSLGPLQFLGVVRRRLPIAHRLIGYVYVLSVAVGVVGALALARTPGGVAANAFAFNMLALLWTASTAMALFNARAKRWRQHQAWMVRSFALTFAAVTLRAGMPVLGWLGFQPSEFYTIVAWASWTINLIVAEWLVLPWLAHSAFPVGRAAASSKRASANSALAGKRLAAAAFPYASVLREDIQQCAREARSAF